jgi:NADPH:quinone reductase-like Zn-dependent oxidoreductase
VTAAMRAVVLRAAGGPEQVACERVAVPSPGPAEALAAPESGIMSVYFVVDPDRPQLVQIAELLDGGWPPPAVDSVFPLEDAAGAFERSMLADKRGKVVLGPRA